MNQGLGFAGKLLIIGLDGLSWPLLEPLIQAGRLPHLARLRDQGAWGPLTSVIPTQSATAWASFITGQNPARHGVLDFMQRQADGTYRHAKPAPSSTLWHHLGRGGVRVGVLNFPVTYPPDAVNGFLISGMLSPPGRPFTYPATLEGEIRAAVPGYRLDLEWQLYAGREQALLADAIDMTRYRAQAACYLQERYAPDFLAVAFIGPDRLQHALWRHLDPSHPYHDAVRAGELAGEMGSFFAALDDAVGGLVAGAGSGANVLVLSDHGFQPAAWQFRVDDWLAERGWLARRGRRSLLERLGRRLDVPWVRRLRRRLVKDVSRHLTAFAPGGTLDWSRTAAFGPWNEQQGIRLNVMGRDPHGTVPPGADVERLRDEIARQLAETFEPRTGWRVVDRIWTREELYSGPFLEAMPDLVLTLCSGFASSPLQPRLWDATGWASGDHSLEGMFIAWGPRVVPGRVERAALVDVAPTALYLLGLAVPEEMDGRVLTSALEPAWIEAHPIRREPRPAPGLTGPPRDDGLTAGEEAGVRERLRGLGYL